MFKKPKRNQNIRRGEVSFDQAEQDEANERVEKPAKPIKSGLLSFDHDEDDENEVFQVKKSSLSRRLKKEKKKKSHKSSAEAGKVSPSTSLPTQHSARKEIEIRSDDGLEIRLKKSHKEEKVEVEDKIEDLTMEDDDEADEKFSNSHGFMSHAFRQGVIPDAAAIHAARKSRQRAREQGDFIALSSKKDDPADEKKRKEIFSDEEVDSADEYENMVAYSKNDKHKRHENFQPIEVDDDDDEMNEDWEAQQVRKVVTTAKLNSMNNLPFNIIPTSQTLFANSPRRDDAAALTTAQLLEQAYSERRMESLASRTRDKDKSKANGIRSPRDILTLLKSKEKTVRHQNTKNVIELDEIAKEIQLIQQDLVNIDKNKPIAMKNFTFYQETKNYFEDLVECLDEKTGSLNVLEERMTSLIAKSSDKLIERRRQDIRDQFEEITERSKKTFTDIPVDNEKRNRRSTEREGRRMRRRKYREKFNFHEVHYEGMSSDEEIPDMESNEFKNNYAQIEEEASKLFDDVCDEFCDLSQVLKRFDEWKKKDLRSYREVYAHLCLPKIVGIFARHQSIAWNPLTQGFTVDKLEWFHESMMFGVQPKETTESLKNDPDVFLVPSVIEKVYLARIAQMIDRCWDPMSTSQTMKLVRLLLQLSEDFPSLRTTSRILQQIFLSLTAKFKDCLNNDILIPLLHKQNDSQFYERQFHGAVKLFRNIVSFQGILSDKVLKEIAITSLFNRYLSQALNMYQIKDRIIKTNLIISTLPKRSNFEIGDILGSYMKNLQLQASSII